jgi:hypothetical protein
VLTRRWLYEPMSQQLGFEGVWWTPRTLWIPERGDSDKIYPARAGRRAGGGDASV